MIPELAVTRVASNHVHGVGLEQIFQRKSTLAGSQVVRGFGCNIEAWISRGSCHIVLDLGNQRGNKVKRLVNLGKLIQQLDHPIVIFERMQPDPREAVLARNQILVKRLVLMPENNHAQNGH